MKSTRSSMFNIVVCDKCNKELVKYDASDIPPCGKLCYQVCWDCLEEWHDDGYEEMWLTLYRANSRELADKFMLDFLGKLG